MSEFEEGIAQEEEISLQDYFEVLKRRRHIVYYFTAAVVFLVMFYSFAKKPVYEAKGTVLIDRADKNVLIFRDTYAIETGQMDEYFNTQVKILKSRTLAKKVIKELSLLEKEEFGGEKGGLLALVSSAFKKSSAEQDDFEKLSRTIDVFLEKLKVNPISKTRLVEVKFRSTDPKLASDVVNTLFDKYIEFNLEMKTESTKMASEYLSQQIEDLRRNLAKKERELQEYSQRKQLFYLSEKESTVLEKFADLNKAYTEAQIDRINKEANYRELKGKPYESYPQVVKNPLIQRLKEEYSKLEAEYKKKSEIFKPEYPEMQRLRSQLEALRKRIAEETKNIAEKALKEAEAAYYAALKKENYLKNLLEEQKKNVVSVNASAIYYKSLKIEVENMRNLLDYLIRKQKESLLSARLEGLQTSNIKVVDFAEPPLEPVSPKKKLNFVIALLFGLMGGVFLAFFVEFLDNTVKSPEEVEKFLKMPALGIVPAVGTDSHLVYSYYYGDREKKRRSKDIKEIELVNFKNPDSAYAEYYRNVRTSIMLSKAERPPQIISVTSSLPREGKTASAVNLAIAFAQLEKKVLIIDADMRKPRIHRIFRLKNTEGLSTFLVGKTNLRAILKETQIPNLFVITSGPVPPNPTELLNSKRMQEMLEKLREYFDFIFIDTPPVMGMADPVIVGKYADGVILVAWGGNTSRTVIERTRDELAKYDIQLLGLLLNKLNVKKTGYGYYYSYSYRYKYREPSEKEKGTRPS